MDVSQITRDPAWFAHRYVEGADAVQFVRVTRAQHAAATFATDAYLPAGLPRREVARREAVVAAPAPARVHFVFHSAFCCSTLVARALDREGIATSLKEPAILNDLVGWRRRGAAGRDVAEAVDGALKLLARPFESGEAVVIKPSNIVTGLIPLTLALRPDARALLLHAPLPVFLTSVAKKGLDGRLWVRELLAGFRRDGLAERLGFDDAALFGQTDLQVAASGWLIQQSLFAELAAQYPDRVRAIDSETLLDAPAPSMEALAALFGLAHDRAMETAFGRNAKTGAAFTRADRAAEYAEAGAAHRDELDKVAAWSEAVARGLGIPMRLPGALL